MKAPEFRIQESFTPLIDSILTRTDISPAAKIIYAQLYRYRAGHDRCFVRIDTLAAACGLDRDVVSRQLLELASEKIKLIEIETVQGRKARYYKLLDNRSSDKCNADTSVDTQSNIDSDIDSAHKKRVASGIDMSMLGTECGERLYNADPELFALLYPNFENSTH